jgi:hypothetical protein
LAGSRKRKVGPPSSHISNVVFALAVPYDIDLFQM